MATQLNFDCRYDDRGAVHGRKLTIRYRDGTCAIIIFDQGFGYWRDQTNQRHNFLASCQQQTKWVLDSNAFVAGHGESYIAITKEDTAMG